MRILLVTVVAFAPTLAFGYEPIPVDRNDKNCKILTDRGVTNCKLPEPGSPGDTLRKEADKRPSFATYDFYEKGRAKAMEELRRRLHEERLERGYQAPPKVERRI